MHYSGSMNEAATTRAKTPKTRSVPVNRRLAAGGPGQGGGIGSPPGTPAPYAASAGACLKVLGLAQAHFATVPIS